MWAKPLSVSRPEQIPWLREQSVSWQCDIAHTDMALTVKDSGCKHRKNQIHGCTRNSEETFRMSPGTDMPGWTRFWQGTAMRYGGRSGRTYEIPLLRPRQGRHTAKTQIPEALNVHGVIVHNSRTPRDAGTTSRSACTRRSSRLHPQEPSAPKSGCGQRTAKEPVQACGLLCRRRGELQLMPEDRSFEHAV